MRSVGMCLATIVAVVVGAGTSCAQDQAQLSGQWTVESIGGVGVGGDSRAAIAFAGDATVSGSGGCNRLIGRADISGAAITFGRVATTRMACSGPVMDQERRLLDALAATRGYRITGSVLMLHDASGVELVRLTRRP
jgi:heat shock protein HslJ